MTETDPEKRLIGYAWISTYGRMLDTQLSRAHLRRRRRSGIGRLTDPTAVAQLWLRAGSSCPKAAVSAFQLITSWPGRLSAPHRSSVKPTTLVLCHSADLRFDGSDGHISHLVQS